MAIDFRWFCLVATLAASAALSVPVSLADERVITGNDQNLSVHEMEVKREQTLNIKKLLRNPHDDPIPGDKPYGGVEGLTFRLSKVQGVDVTTNDGRESAKGYTVQRAWNEGFIETREAKTNADGVAVFEQLGPGLYLIEESAPDENHHWRLSRPQLVILPLGDVMGEDFSYDNVLVTKPHPGEMPPTTPGVPPNEPGIPPSAPGDPKEPGTPPETPVLPGQPGYNAGEQGRHSGEDERTLAVTGVNVILAFAIGVVMITLGFVLMRRTKN